MSLNLKRPTSLRDLSQGSLQKLGGVFLLIEHGSENMS